MKNFIKTTDYQAEGFISEAQVLKLSEDSFNKDIERILLSETQIKTAIEKLGAQITADYKGKNPLLVGILKGSVVFLSDLMREINLPCSLDFTVVKSYGMSSESSGELDIIKDLEFDINGRDVILIEDILDSGNTLNRLIHTLLKRNPNSVKTAVFLNKNVNRVYDLKADYKCFDIENEFVVGYGLDYAEMFRNLPYVGVLKREFYENK